jgi:cysteinyl-tRNA synthetase
LLTNTVTGKQQTFKAREESKVTMYVCGITPYDEAHIGHGRCYVTFDLLYRMQKFIGLHVVYCRNFTDIDDKLLIRAEKEFGDQQMYKYIADRYIDRYHKNMASLNCLSPDYEPRVTDHIPEIIDFIIKLIQAGYAYVSGNDVYFSIKRFPSYGKLSKHKIEDLRSAHRIHINDKKEDQLDFALWKGEEQGTFWKSPWGYGRPGWHIECSALAARYLGTTIDIHGGGLDLVFPHHENEIAQSESLHGKELAHYWVHNGLLRVNQAKMSKSEGNFFTLTDVFKDFDPMVVRYYLLTHHYRSPIEFSFDDMKASEKSYQKLIRTFNEDVSQSENAQTKYSPTDTEMLPIVCQLLRCLEDDLNTPAMFGVLFENLDSIKHDHTLLAAVKAFLQNVVGLTLASIPEKVIELSDRAKELIEERQTARIQKNWTRADEIRQELIDLGVVIHDERT